MKRHLRQSWRILLRGAAAGGRGTRALSVAALACVACGAAGYRQISSPLYRYRLALGAELAGDNGLLGREAQRLGMVRGHAAQARLLWAKVRARQGQLEEAAALLQLARRSPQSDLKVEACLLFAQCLMKAGSYADARGLLAEAYAAAPRRADVHRWYAELFLQLNAHALAMDAASKAAELAPRDPRPLALVGTSYLHIFGRPAPAAAALRESLRRNPEQFGHAELRLDYVEALGASGRPQEALAELRQLAPETYGARAMYLEARCLRLSGHSQAAWTVLQRALSERGEDPDFLLLAAQILVDRSDGGAALAPLLLLVERYPRNANVHRLLTTAYALTDQREQARQHSNEYARLVKLAEQFEEVLGTAEEEPWNPDVRCRLATLAHELGRDDEARRWLQAALALDPDHAHALTALGALDREGAATQSVTLSERDTIQP